MADESPLSSNAPITLADIVALARQRGLELLPGEAEHLAPELSAMREQAEHLRRRLRDFDEPTPFRPPQ